MTIADEQLADYERRERDSDDGTGVIIRALCAEVRRMRAAPLGYDAGGITVRTPESDPVCTSAPCPATLDLAAIVTRTLGDDAVARAERAVVEAAIEWYAWPYRTGGSARLYDICAALRRAREAGR